MAELTAEVQTTDPPRVQIVATELVGEIELLTDPGFEDGGAAWTGTFDLWNGLEEPFLLAPSEGGLYAHVALTAPTTAAVLSQAVQATGGSQIEASLDLAGTPDVGANLTLRATPTLAGVPNGDPVSDQVEAIDVWQTLALGPFTLPADSDGLLLEVTTNGDAGFELLADNGSVHTLGSGTLNLYREVDGSRLPVRGAIDVRPTSGAVVFIDYGAPFNVDVYYVLELVYDDGTVEEVIAGPVVLTSDQSWINNPITGQGLQVTIAEWTELEYAARRTLVDVAGRRAPIVVSDVRSTAASELILYTPTRDDLKALRQILATGDVLQLRPVCDAVEPAYLAVGDVTETRHQPTGPGAGSNWQRLVSMSVQEVDQPAPQIPALGDTLADLHRYSPGTLADLANDFGAGATLLTIATADLTTQGTTL